MSTTSPVELTAALHRFGLERDRFRTALARALHIPQADLDALEHLELAGPLTQRDLGTRLLLTSGGVTVLVDRLERAGLVRRGRHPTDRRMTVVELVPDPPVRDVPELEAYHQAARADAEALSPAAREYTVAFLTAMAENAARGTRMMSASHGSASTDRRAGGG
jgi:MarR family